MTNEELKRKEINEVNYKSHLNDCIAKKQAGTFDPETAETFDVFKARRLAEIEAKYSEE